MCTALFPQKRASGFTLIELVVGLLVGSITLTVLLTFFRFQTVSLRTENARRAAQVTARGAMNFIVRHLEHVGRANQTRFTVAVPAIQTVATDQVAYVTNLSQDWSDNDTTDPWENVTFRYDSGAIMVNDVNGIGDQALTDTGTNQKSYIPSGGLVFTYFDGNGNVVAPGSAAAARASIRRINVSLTVRGIVPPGEPEPEVTIAQDVFLRNVS